jgi:hypothetical protein
MAEHGRGLAVTDAATAARREIPGLHGNLIAEAEGIRGMSSRRQDIGPSFPPQEIVPRI